MSFSDRVSGSAVYLPAHCLWLTSKGVWRCGGVHWIGPQVAMPPKQSSFAHRWLRHPNRAASPTGGYATQTEWLRPQVATPPTQSGFAHRGLRHPNGVASPAGGYAAEGWWRGDSTLNKGILSPKPSTPPTVESGLSTE